MATSKATSIVGGGKIGPLAPAKPTSMTGTGLIGPVSQSNINKNTVQVIGLGKNNQPISNAYVIPKTGQITYASTRGVQVPSNVGVSSSSTPRIGVSSMSALNSAGINTGGSTPYSMTGTGAIGPVSIGGSLSNSGGTSLGGGSTTPSSNVINAPDVLNNNNTKVIFPEPPVTDYSKYIPTPVEKATTDVSTASKDRESSLKSYLDTLLKEAPSSADAYKKAQQETQILQKQQAVNDLTAQLNSIVNKGQASQLSLVGQGRGIPEAIIGGQQAQIGRETAIAALPIQAQLSAAQGNLEMANDNLDTLFKIYSEDAQNAFTYKREVKKAFYDLATEKEKRALDKMDKLEERAYQETQDLMKERADYAKMAFSTGQSSLGSKIAKLDYKSPTFADDLSILSSQIRDTKRELEIQKLQKDLVAAGTTISPKVLGTTQFKNAQAAQNLKLTLQEAKAAVEKYGNYENLNATGKGILDTLKIRLASQISTALEQGVVMPGEMENFQKVAGQLNSSNWLGIPNVRNKKTMGSINSLISSMDTRVALQKAAITNTYGITPEQVDTLLNITDLSDQEYNDMDAIVE